MKLQKDSREFIELLNSEKTDYIIVGAHALAYHGHPRFTGDLDVFVRVSPDNARKIYAAIRAFGFAELGPCEEDFLSPDQVMQLGVAPHRIDLLTSIDGVDFEQAWRDRTATRFEDVSVNIISRDHLIQNKQAAGRPQNLAYVDALLRTGN